MTDSEAKEAVQALNTEIASLLHALNQAHRGWVVPRLASQSTRVSTYIAFRVMLRTFNLDDMSEGLRNAANKLADEVVVTTAPASEVLSKSGEVGQA